MRLWQRIKAAFRRVRIGEVLAGVGMVIAGAAASVGGVGVVGVVGGVATIARAFRKKGK